MNSITLGTRAQYVLAILAASFVFAYLCAPSAYAAPLTRQLEEGMRGDDVSSLQTLLAQDPALYPEALVTGYFGPLTKAAVMRFQTRNGISAVGRVGPITLAAINGQMTSGGGVGTGSDVNAPIILGAAVSASQTSAQVEWTTTEPASGTVYYGTTFPAMSESLHDVTISGTVAQTDTALRTTHQVSINGLQPNTTYYYVIYTKDAAGNVQMIWPVTFKTQ